MQRGSLISELVVYVDDNLITEGSCHYRKRPCIVDADGCSRENAIRIRNYPGDVEIVNDRLCLHDRGQKNQQKR